LDAPHPNGRDGFLIRTDRQYFFGIGFVDWSLMPVGGRFEELCWLQCRYVEGLRTARTRRLVCNADLRADRRERAAASGDKVKRASGKKVAICTR
jgi:hypothetical protein